MTIMDRSSLIADCKKTGTHTAWGTYPALLLFLFFIGCAETGPIHLSVSYQPPAEQAGTASRVSVGLSPLRDVREKPIAVLGVRKISDSVRKDLVTQGTVAGLVTDAFRSALKARGIIVKDASSWDLTAEHLENGGTGLVIGGEIKELWLESATLLATNLKASVRLRIVVADLAAKKIIKTIEVNSAVEQDVLYSSAKLESVLSEALSGAINQVFKDEDLKKRLQ